MKYYSNIAVIFLFNNNNKNNNNFNFLSLGLHLIIKKLNSQYIKNSVIAGQRPLGFHSSFKMASDDHKSNDKPRKLLKHRNRGNTVRLIFNI